jgi:hypothetical protein
MSPKILVTISAENIIGGTNMDSFLPYSLDSLCLMKANASLFTSYVEKIFSKFLLAHFLHYQSVQERDTLQTLKHTICLLTFMRC